jgi:hypothetical protein
LEWRATQSGSADVRRESKYGADATEARNEEGSWGCPDIARGNLTPGN